MRGITYDWRDVFHTSRQFFQVYRLASGTPVLFTNFLLRTYSQSSPLTIDGFDEVIAGTNAVGEVLLGRC